DLRPRSEAVARGAHPERGVEGEALRAELRIALATTRTIRAEGNARLRSAGIGDPAPRRAARLRRIGDVGRNEHLALGFAKCGFARLRQARRSDASDDDAIDDQIDRVLDVLLESGRIVERMRLASDFDAKKAPRLELSEELPVLALAMRDEA